MKQVDIKGFENYQITDDGRVLNKKRNKWLKPFKNNSGYFQVKLHKNKIGKTVLIHRLVAEAFIPNPEGLHEVNHRNEYKDDNSVKNLEWCPKKYNLNYGTRNERIAETNSKPILQYSLDGKLINEWGSLMEVENNLGINHSNISRCCNGKRKKAGGYIWRYKD